MQQMSFCINVKYKNYKHKGRESQDSNSPRWFHYAISTNDKSWEGGNQQRNIKLDYIIGQMDLRDLE